MDRRRFLTGAGGVMLAAQSSRAFGELLSPPADYTCSSTHRLTQGPYLTPNSPLRSDIREGTLGMPLKLKLTVINDVWCEPISNCVVDLWHCDAVGLYSAVENIVFDPVTLAVTDDQPVDLRDKTFLRGHQVTNDQGEVEFLTVFPGWYLPRLAHIHVRTIWNGLEWTALDTQLYLPADVEKAVYETGPYAERGPNPIDIERDIVMKGDTEATNGLTVPLEKDGDGFKGEFTIAATSLG